MIANSKSNPNPYPNPSSNPKPPNPTPPTPTPTTTIPQPPTPTLNLTLARTAQPLAPSPNQVRGPPRERAARGAGLAPGGLVSPSAHAGWG